MADALKEARWAREHSIVAEAEGVARLDEAAAQFKDPNAERLVKQAARAHSLRAGKTCGLLRSVLGQLEEEAAAAQRIHASDMRSMAARLVAQRDAITASVLSDLEDAETNGAHSILGLQQELRALREESAGQLDARDAEIDALRVQLATVRAELVEETLARRRDQERSDLELRIMRRPIDELEFGLGNGAADLIRSLRERQVIALELSSEESARAADAREHRRQQTNTEAAKLSERRDMEKKLNTQLAANGLKQQAEKAEMAALEEKAKALEAGMAGQIKRLKIQKASESRSLQAKIDLLAQQVVALRSSKSIRRSYLYWSGNQTRGPEKTHESLESLQLADPDIWRKPALPPEVYDHR